MQIILISIFSLGLMGLICGGLLAYANQKFHREEDPRLELLLAVLPGSNCGACGYPGCHSLAEAILANKVDVDSCLLGGEKTACEVARVMGVEAGQKEKLVAVLKCGGGVKESPQQFDYRGLQTCQAAQSSSGGFKSCGYGCLGLADCSRVCPVDCISISENGLPVVNRGKCIACGKCVDACPRGLFILLPMSAKYHVNCSSKDKGAVVREVCKVGCIACNLCVKKCPHGAISINDFLAVIDQSKCKQAAECIKVCPAKCIIKLS